MTAFAHICLKLKALALFPERHTTADLIAMAGRWRGLFYLTHRALLGGKISNNCLQDTHILALENVTEYDH